MRIVYKAIIIFFIFTFVVAFGVKEFVQSKKFSDLLSFKINELISRHSNLDLKFKRIRVNAFPPITFLEDVSMSYRENDVNVVTNFSEIGIKFNFLYLLAPKLRISELIVHGGNVNLNLELKEKDNEEEKNLADKIADVFKFLNNLPVKIRALNLKDLNLKINGNSLSFDQSYVDVFDNIIEAKLNIADLKIHDKESDFSENIDYVNIDAQVTTSKVWIKGIKIGKELDKLSFSGDLLLSSKNEEKIKGDITYEGSVAHWIKKFKIDHDWLYNDPYISASVSMEVDLKNRKIETSDIRLDGFDVSSEYANLDRFSVSARLEDDLVKIQKLKVEVNGGKVTHVNPFYVFNVKQKVLYQSDADIIVENLHTNDVFHFLGDDLSDLKGFLNGKINVKWTDKDINFKMYSGFNLDDFQLKSEDKEVPLISNKKLIFDNSNFHVDYEGDVAIDTYIKFKNSFLSAKGVIGESGINIKINDSKFNFLELGPISTTQLIGDGKIVADISGNFDKVIFDFKYDINDFSVLKFNLGHAVGSALFDLSEVKLTIPGSKGANGETEFNLKGEVDFAKELVSLDLDFTRARYQDTLIIYKPIIDNIKNIPRDLNFNYKSKYSVRGNFDPDSLIVKGSLLGNNFTYGKEDVDRANFKFTLKDQNILISNLEATKGAAMLSGNFFMNIKNGYVEYDAELINLNLEEINYYGDLGLGYSSEIYGEFYGSGIAEDFSSRSIFKLSNSKIGSIKIEDSSLSVFTNGYDVHINGALVGKRINIQSYLNLDDGNSGKKSFVDIDLDFPDIRYALGIINYQNIDDVLIEGALNASMEAKFDLNHWKDLDLKYKFNSFEFRRGDLSLDVNADNDIEIKSGDIKKWNISLVGGNQSFKSKGNGNLIKGFKFDHEFSFDASMLEILNKNLIRTSGKFFGKNTWTGSENNFDNYLKLDAKDLTLVFDGVPVTLKDADLSATLNNKELLVQKFNSKIGEGNLSAYGSVTLSFPYPEIKMKIDVDNAFLPFYKNSFLTVSGHAEVVGDTVPYACNANFSIVQAEIKESFPDLIKNSSSGENYEKYVPSNSTIKSQANSLKLNIFVDILKPILFKNNMADMLMDGSLFIAGNLNSPNITGKIDTVPNESKFIFKGHEFRISQGSIILDGKQAKIKPDLSFIGLTRVNDYDIKLSVQGRPDNLGVNLNSTPALSQQDILSLLTIGITQDTSRDLEEKDRQSITTMGIGSLLVDQLEISEGIKSSLGLKVSVSPEFNEGNRSPLGGRLSEGNSGITNRMKSSTRVQVQKKINEKVDMSVSSTVGGAIEQSQKMNVNYYINKNVSLQGVYEVKTSEEEEANNLDSIGADVKYRWSF